VTLTYRAAKDDPNGVNVNDALIVEAIDHAAEFGSISAEGRVEVADESLPTRWRSEAEGASQRREVPVDPSTREVTGDTEAGSRQGGGQRGASRGRPPENSGGRPEGNLDRFAT